VDDVQYGPLIKQNAAPTLVVVVKFAAPGESRRAHACGQALERARLYEAEHAARDVLSHIAIGE
jgi:hypothetical protein